MDNPSQPNARNPRRDGDSTRQNIMENAGRLFAELGYDGTTSKAICQQAETNLASVNYHFGSKDGLYEAVLIEAHRRLISLEALSQIAQSEIEPRAKFGLLVDGLIDGLVDEGWHMRVFVRELISPSPAFEVMLKSEAVPKLVILKKLISDITGLSADDPALARCFLTTAAPTILLLMAKRSSLSRVMADFWQDTPALKAHLKIFTLAGLDAVVAAQKKL